MPISAVVYAPNTKQDTIIELSQTITTSLQTAVSFTGQYGNEKTQPAVYVPELPDLISTIDLKHYWAGLQLLLSGAILVAGNKVIEKLCEVLLEWAIKHRQDNKKAKIKIYGPDNKLIKELDA